MISVIAPSRKSGGSPSALIEYIFNDRNVEYSHISSLGEVQTAAEFIEEIKAVQAMNTRGSKDQILHIVLSFHKEDDLSAKTLQGVERDIVEGLGVGEHQRISALHTDTDHPHLHIALNKIHPETFKTARLSFSKLRLVELSEQIEQRYKLRPDPHQPKRLSLMSDGAASIEAQQGEISMISQMRALKSELLQQSSWDKLHKTLTRNGFSIEKQGQGAVFRRYDEVYIKCSRIKGMSLPALVKRLGEFKPAPVNLKVAQKLPPSFPHTLKKLQRQYWTEYMVHKDQAFTAKQKSLQAIQKEREAIFERSRARFEQIKRNNKKQLRSLYSVNKMQRMIELEALSERRKSLPTVPGYADWLASKAATDDNALRLLRHRKARAPREQSIAGIDGYSEREPFKLTQLGAIKYAIKRNGDAVYTMGDIVIRDRGFDIHINKLKIDQANLVFLKFAQTKYGKHLKLNGSEKFKRKMLKLAHDSGLDITFTDDFSRRYAAQLQQSQSTAAGFVFNEYLGKFNQKEVQAFIKQRQAHGEGYQIFTKDCLDRQFTVAGVRQVGNQKGVLLTRKDKRYVLPLTEARAQQIRRLKRSKGALALTFTRHGAIKTTSLKKLRRKI